MNHLLDSISNHTVVQDPAAFPDNYIISITCHFSIFFTIPVSNKRTEFTLDESGDVSWKVPEVAEPMPFFMCETYEVI